MVAWQNNAEYQNARNFLQITKTTQGNAYLELHPELQQCSSPSTAISIFLGACSLASAICGESDESSGTIDDMVNETTAKINELMKVYSNSEGEAKAEAEIELFNALKAYIDDDNIKRKNRTFVRFFKKNDWNC
ncbi:hypothetical protein IKB17_02800 [bacterium]|nr:hypothetical protein [bacterium]